MRRKLSSQPWSTPFKLKFDIRIYDYQSLTIMDMEGIRENQQLAFLFVDTRTKFGSSRNLLSCADSGNSLLAKGSNGSALICPMGCLDTGHHVYGVPLDQGQTGYKFAKESSICKAAIAQGTITNQGGAVRIKINPKPQPTQIQYYQLQGIFTRIMSHK